MATLDATVGGAASNSYITLAEANDYWESAPFNTAWEDLDDDVKTALLIRATRILEGAYAPHRTKHMCPNGCDFYYVISPTWTGTPTSTTQALSWPRTGMTNRNGGPIPSNIIPQEIKDAQAELTGQMAREDRTADSDAGALGITNVTAGPVSVSFKDGAPTSNMIPDAVEMLLLPGWLTDETIEYSNQILFEVL